MRASRFLLLVGIITISAIFYVYQQCSIAVRPFEKRVERLASMDFDQVKKGNTVLDENTVMGYTMVNGEFSRENINLQVAKK